MDSYLRHAMTSWRGRAFLVVSAVFFLALLLAPVGTVFAADDVAGLVSKGITQEGFATKMTKDMSTALGSDFTNNLVTLFKSFQDVARKIVVMMTATAGIMIALGLSSANQLFLKWIFGIGVVLNVADFGWSMFADYWVAPDTITNPDMTEKLNALTTTEDADGNPRTDVFSGFMMYLSDGFLKPAFARIMPIAVKLTFALWLIDVSIKVALGLLQQDLVNFFLKQIMKLGIYIFLITNWWPTIYGGNAEALSGSAGGNIAIMESLGKGFQTLGFYAAGEGDDKKDEANKDKVALQADSIWNNTLVLWNKAWDLELKRTEKDGDSIDKALSYMKMAVNGLKFATSPFLIIGLALFITVCCVLIYLALEMFMARVEFYVMAVLSVILLPFAMIEQLKFLSDKAISLMFNLALKNFVIAFLSVFVVEMLNLFLKKFIEAQLDSFLVDLTSIIQLGLVCVLALLIVKKIPELVNGLLSGNPSLSGGDMMGQMKSAVVGGLAIAGTAAAAVATGGAAAAGGFAAAGGSAGGAKAILGGLKAGAESGLRMGGNYIATQNPFSRSFADSMNRFGGTAEGGKGLGMKGGFTDGLGIKGGEANGGNVTPLQALSNIASVYSGNPPPYGRNADSGKPDVDDPKKSGTGADGDTGQKPKDEPQSASGTPNKEETGDKAPIVMATAERPDGDKQFFHTKESKESKEKEVRTEPKGGAQPVVQGAPYQPGAASFPQGDVKTASGIVLPNTDSGRQSVQQVQSMSAAPQGDTRSASNVSMQNSMSSNVQNVMSNQVTNQNSTSVANQNSTSVTNQNSTSVANQNISNISNNLSGGGTGGMEGGAKPSIAEEAKKLSKGPGTEY